MSEKEAKIEEKKPILIKNATDLQRLKLEKLMKNPVRQPNFIVSVGNYTFCLFNYKRYIPMQEKPVILPEPPKQKSLAPPPDFVRNVMGSSAGAGSGEFHVYRHLRRKEYARQKFIQEKSEKVIIGSLKINAVVFQFLA